MDSVQIFTMSGIILIAAAMAGGMFERWGLRTRLKPWSRVGLGLLGVACLGLSWAYSRPPSSPADIPNGGALRTSETEEPSHPTYQIETRGDASPVFAGSSVEGDVIVEGR